MITLGLDIGTNSVGSAWVDLESMTFSLAASHFPAGVDESEFKRGEPLGRKRRGKRSQRGSLERRAERKHRLRRDLIRANLLPDDSGAREAIMQLDPWQLRRKGLTEVLTPHEFGRVLVHLNQRRGALGIETDPEDKDEGKVKEAIDHTIEELKNRTFGQMIADLMDERRRAVNDKEDKFFQMKPIRNRRDAFEFHADRSLIRNEFDKLWEQQKSFDSTLSGLLTDVLKRQLDDPSEDGTWRHKGTIFGQRRTYWDTGTLGRCDLEPAEQRCPQADMYAQEFRVLETVNNIRLSERGKPEAPLDSCQRDNVIKALRSQKSGSVATVRTALGINKKNVKAFYSLDIERDPDREINTNWFYREIVHGVFGEERWKAMSDREKDSVNRAILKFDPDKDEHSQKLAAGAVAWCKLSDDAAAKLIAAWKTRPRLEKRVNLSRRALRNLLNYLREGLSVTEARQRFAEDESSVATAEQRALYAFTVTNKLRDLLNRLVGVERTEALLHRRGTTRADRQFLEKHDDPLPPAPMLANPVVRKAIHEVRRHVIAHIRREKGRIPDRIMIELTRSAKQSEQVRQATLDRNRKREAIRKKIIDDFHLAGLSMNQQRAAVERVILCRQQQGKCPYSPEPLKQITELAAAKGEGVETDHIVPYSRCGDNSLNNKVLCFRASNRGKGNKTPREWLGTRFDDHLKRLEFFNGYKPTKGDTNEYFTAKDYARKWDNLTREIKEDEAWGASQLTDTAYAANQVATYLRETLYSGERDGKKHLFFTKGFYTSMLRKDWKLFQTALTSGEAGAADGATVGIERTTELKSAIEKERGDHRHHAIDALVIALTDPGIEKKLAGQAAYAEEYHDRTGNWRKRDSFEPPWAGVDAFRGQVMTAVDKMVVSHRPVKRKIIGAFHEETAYGPVLLPDGSVSETLFTNRIRAQALSPNHLKVPAGWDELSAKLDDPALPELERRSIGRRLANLPDPPTGKSGIVRDRALRDRIRKCLRANQLNPDEFSKNAIKKLVDDEKLKLPSGVPIHSVVLLRTINDPIVIARKRWDEVQQCFVHDRDPRTKRVYIGGNNHHIEIRENPKTGRWTGEVIDTFTAAQRVRIGKRDAVDRSDNQDGPFMMSMAEGETIYMKHPESGKPDYFVVFKLNKGQRRIFFIHHWDARPSKPKKDENGKEILGTQREEIDVVPSALQNLGVEPGKPPYKVRVSPLGEVSKLQRD